MLAFVAVYIHGTELLALVDTGSEATLVSLFLVNCLNLSINREYRGFATHHTSSALSSAAPVVPPPCPVPPGSSAFSSSDAGSPAAPSRALSLSSRAAAGRTALHLNENQTRGESGTLRACESQDETEAESQANNEETETEKRDRQVEQAAAASQLPASQVSVHGAGSAIVGRVENLQVTFPVFSVETEDLNERSVEATTGPRETKETDEERPAQAEATGAIASQNQSRGAEAACDREAPRNSRLEFRKPCLLPVICDAIVLEEPSQHYHSSLPRAASSSTPLSSSVRTSSVSSARSPSPVSPSSSVLPASQFLLVLGLDALVALDAVVDLPRRRLLIGNGRFAATLFFGDPSALGAYLR
ncbi:hypothetical protein TGGT1_268390 [Toxoplasma gondii GT1]|uniref:Uncharacterized protein n=2 Tax=Toxoplasma gondii TaxID=5811 RepID=S7V4W7_TOXGG|nr:hypothetical protein TGGT1_268390 [Toxoplasma gondii GT1]KAF4642459.1 hypothetical protein TGRH88_082740 [Toxoplasma gondii]